MNTSMNIVANPIANQQPTFLPMLAPRQRAANDHTKHDAEIVAHRDAVERVYREAFESLRKYALRYVEDPTDAADVVHEAFALLLDSPRRKPTRAAAWCIVRDLARGRRAERASTEAYVEGEDFDDDLAGAWLKRALGG
jgi:DNA-directed RNA polymerase specialized sigma24 family protein